MPKTCGTRSKQYIFPRKQGLQIEKSSFQPRKLAKINRKLKGRKKNNKGRYQ